MCHDVLRGLVIFLVIKTEVLSMSEPLPGVVGGFVFDVDKFLEFYETKNLRNYRKRLT